MPAGAYIWFPKLCNKPKNSWRVHSAVHTLIFSHPLCITGLSMIRRTSASRIRRRCQVEGGRFTFCGRLSWLTVSFLLHVKYPLSYRILTIASTCCCILYPADIQCFLGRLITTNTSPVNTLCSVYKIIIYCWTAAINSFVRPSVVRPMVISRTLSISQ